MAVQHLLAQLQHAQSYFQLFVVHPGTCFQHLWVAVHGEFDPLIVTFRGYTIFKSLCLIKNILAAWHFHKLT